MILIDFDLLCHLYKRFQVQLLLSVEKKQEKLIDHVVDRKKNFRKNFTDRKILTTDTFCHLIEQLLQPGKER